LTGSEASTITVLMPVRAHHPSYLAEAIGSLHAQTSPRWRLLIVVERAAVAAFERALADQLTDSRVALIANRGRKLAGAFNTGMRHAETEFTAILLGDDMWSPEAVEVLERRVRQHPEADFFHSSRRFVDERGRPISGIHHANSEIRPADFLEASPVKHLLCWRREKALALGGMDESLNSVGPDDYDFPWTMAEQGATFVAVPECLYVFRDHRECYRLTTHLPRKTHERELRRIMRKHGVGERAIRRQVAAARRSYLRQCLYSTRLHAWVKTRLGADARNGWRDTYA
jgi:glycosyltransferase involved in cell wall biosynthesis